MKSGVMLMFCWMTMTASGVGCSKKKEASKDWPDRPLVEKRDTIKGVSFSISVPKGVGMFRGPNVLIYRHVGPSFAFFIKVTKEEALPDPKAVKAELAQDSERKLVRLDRSKTTAELIVEEAPNKRHSVLIWQKKGQTVLQCQALLGQKIGGPQQVKKSNAWILRMCRSLKIVAP